MGLDLLDPKRYFTGKPRLSKRHRVRDNLLGTGKFCPIIRRTRVLTELLELDLAAKARETVGRTGAHLVARAASFFTAEGVLNPARFAAFYVPGFGISQ